ncbi:DNA circulation family protein [Paraburkholderia piptadeniae]|uniref:DNA circulation family protein n=1 Tax=Paraburkholderia piptadeniae TaxID=1701573 RepID=A0A1N7SSY8_9BURK|nr:DNA circularization N-terminal domain-containing protein [Paraburkholderia piptadeniae]SIT50436.1 DNA circulation family protein [Paraburkholderia piptadeniae]
MSFTSTIGSLSAASRAVGSLASTLSGGSFATNLRTASYGGIPFGIEGVTTSGGRRVSVHSYPFRDTVWIEDLGLLPKVFRISGFLIENSAIYGGGGVVSQANALMAVCNAAGGKTFVHPTLGTIQNVSCIEPLQISERKDLGRVFEIGLTLMQGGARVYPKASNATGDQVKLSGLAAIAAALLNFASKVASYVTLGVSIVNQAIATVSKWYAVVKSVIADVKAVIGAVSSLSGSYGRYASGANTGYAKSNAKASSTATVASLLSAAVTQRTAVQTAGANMVSAASSVGDTAAFSAAITAVAASVAATAANPADAIRMLSTLADFYPDDPTTSSVIGDGMAGMQSAIGALVRTTVIAQMAMAATSYQPSSADDAASVRDLIVSLVDDEVVTAGDAGDDETYGALRTLRTAVIADINSRGGSLPAMTTFSFASALPALALSSRMYRDASRADEIIAEANPIHPAFMPSSFAALAT